MPRGASPKTGLAPSVSKSKFNDTPFDGVRRARSRVLRLLGKIPGGKEMEMVWKRGDGLGMAEHV